MPAVKRFAVDFLTRKDPARWLTILGPSGIGKTLIMGQLYRFLKKRRARGHVYTTRHVQAGIDLADYEAPADYGKMGLIYLEDFAADTNPVIYDRSVELLRYRPFRWTLIDCNLSLEELGQRCPRVASRVLRDGSEVVEIPLSVPDYNLRPS